MATRLPKYAACAAPRSPAGPAPITTRSKGSVTQREEWSCPSGAARRHPERRSWARTVQRRLEGGQRRLRPHRVVERQRPTGGTVCAWIVLLEPRVSIRQAEGHQGRDVGLLERGAEG